MGTLFSEAEYAFQLRKLIIPLKMELNFDAREWLGLIIGTKLIFEFTDKYPFEEKMSGLLKEIFKIHQEAVPQKPAISKTVSAYTEARLIKHVFVIVETIFCINPINTFLIIIIIIKVSLVMLWKYFVSYYIVFFCYSSIFSLL